MTDQQPTDEDRRTFTSWKLMVLNALMMDARLKPSNKVVAYCLMYHVNANTRYTWVSIETLAAECGLSVSTVNRALKTLAKMGWIARSRESQRETYTTWFLDDHVAGIEQEVQERVEKSRLERENRFHTKREVARVKRQKNRQVSNREGSTSHSW